MDNFDKIIATAHVIANPEGATNELVILRRQLEMAVEMTKRIQEYVMKPYPDWREIMRYCEITLAEIERIGNSHQTVNSDESQCWEG
jgi:hypothetical protein